MRSRFLSAGPRPACTAAFRAALPLGGLARLLALALVPARAHAQQQPATADSPLAAPAAVPVSDGAAGPRRIAPAWQAGTVAAPALPDAVAPAIAVGDTLWTLEARRGSRGQFLLFLVGMVAVGAGTYKLGEALEVEALESTGAFVAGIGLLGIILPIWLFF